MIKTGSIVRFTPTGISGRVLVLSGQKAFIEWIESGNWSDQHLSLGARVMIDFIVMTIGFFLLFNVVTTGRWF